MSLLSEILARKERHFWLIIATIFVSAVHVVSALAAFSGSGFLDKMSAVALTVVLDVATSFLSSYIDFRKRNSAPVAGWTYGLFWLGLGNGFMLNFFYMLKYIPDDMPRAFSLLIAFSFSLFIQAMIAEFSRIQTELSAMAQVVRESAVSITEIPASNEKNEENESLANPLSQPALPLGNNKSAIMASDLQSVCERIAENGGSFKTQAELGQLCEWSSSATPNKAIKLLMANELLAFEDGIYRLK